MKKLDILRQKNSILIKMELDVQILFKAIGIFVTLSGVVLNNSPVLAEHKICLDGNADEWANVTIELGSEGQIIYLMSFCFTKELWDKGPEGHAPDTLSNIITGLIVGQSGAKAEDVAEAVDKTMGEFINSENDTVKLGPIGVTVNYCAKGIINSTQQTIGRCEP